VTTLLCPILYARADGRSIAYAYGDEMDDWIGKEITLSPIMVQFGHGQVGSIRATAVTGKGKPKFMQKEGMTAPEGED
jgi:hypothetical protein